MSWFNSEVGTKNVWKQKYFRNYTVRIAAVRQELNSVEQPSQNSHLKIRSSSVVSVFQTENFKAGSDRAFKLFWILARKYCLNAKYLKLIMLEAYKPAH